MTRRDRNPSHDALGDIDGSRSTPFAHSVATHLRARDHDIRTVQEILGRRNVSATKIPTHVLRHGARGINSPRDTPFVE